MVRTKADAGATKVSAAKAPRKVLTGGAGSSSGGPSGANSRTPGKEKYSGGNGYNPQPTPDWQKGIGNFFKTAAPKPVEPTTPEKKSSAPAEESSSSSSFVKNGLIDDDDE